MGKGFKGKPCAYCGQPGNTADHIFARQFFPPDRRANLPQVCACKACNEAKSRLEHYALSVLPFGGRHPESSAILAAEVPRRLAKNRKLHLHLAEGRASPWVQERGVILPGLTVPFDSERVFALFGMIARALVVFHWGHLVPSGYVAEASALTQFGERKFERIFASLSVAEARGNLGEGLVLYQGVQLLDDPCRTPWRFQIYGGVVLGGAPEAPHETPSNIWARTGPHADGRPWGE